MSGPRLKLKQKNQENAKVSHAEAALSVTRNYYYFCTQRFGSSLDKTTYTATFTTTNPNMKM
jgi:hypothetical protein